MAATAMRSMPEGNGRCFCGENIMPGTFCEIHPVAGHARAHMNVLLAETSNVPYDEFIGWTTSTVISGNVDVAYVISANDITNPLAKPTLRPHDLRHAGLEVERAKTVFFVKRSLAAG